MTRVLMVYILRTFYELARKTGVFLPHPTHRAIAPGVGVNGVWVDAVPQFVTGQLKEWADKASVSSITIPGYWVHKKGSTIPVAAPPVPGEKVIFVMHGGGYCTFSAHPKDPTAAIARGVLQHCHTVRRTFSIEYRLSAGAPDPLANPFPSALLDALAGYNYLVNAVGFAPGDIILQGDSAGGNLALALTRYLVEHKMSAGDARLPALPSAVLLLSPWADMGQSHNVPGGSFVEFAGSDYLDPEQAAIYAGAFLGPHGVDEGEINRYVSPASVHPSMEVSFVGFPRTFILAGGAEIMFDQIKMLRDRMVKDLGEDDGTKGSEGKVTYFEAKDGVHDYLAFRWHEPEREETLKVIGEWVSAV
jgi:acetyl esterase/lipase